MEALNITEIDKILGSREFYNLKTEPIDIYQQTKNNYDVCSSLSPLSNRSSGFEEISSPETNFIEIKRNPCKTINRTWKSIEISDQHKKHFEEIFDLDFQPVASESTTKKILKPYKNIVKSETVAKCVSTKRRETNRKASAAYRERQKDQRQQLELKQVELYQERDRLRLKKRDLDTKANVILEQMELQLQTMCSKI